MIYGCWICYNNIKTIQSSIFSVHKYIDAAIVIDGSFDGRTSDDGTWEAVEGLCRQTINLPFHHVKSKATTLFDKHNEHVEITGNKSQNVFTWQVDSDEIYLPADAKVISEAIRSDKYNGLGVKLITIEAMKDNIAYAAPNVFQTETTQMRIYRMINGLHFESKDGIFEHIVYEDGTPVQNQDNTIVYNNKLFRVYNYHCFDSYEKLVKRYRHYGEKDPEDLARKHMSTEGKMQIPNHPLGR